MPELPEVTTIVRILKPKILNKQIESIDVFYRRLILNEDLDNFKNILINSSIVDIFNIGKFIVIKLNNNHRLIVHLRMEGKLFFFENQNDLPERKYSDSCLIKFKDGSYLLYNDTRKFGIFKLESVDEENSILNNLGIDLFNYNSEQLDKLLKLKNKSSHNVKQFITDQHLILGIGNIYADEILFKTKIAPFKSTKEISDDDFLKLIDNAKVILKLAIDNKGSTVSTYHPNFNEEGKFQNFLKIYDKKGEKCPVCGDIIEKRFLNSRGTSFCPTCQNIKKTISITGPIGCGKSTILDIFKNLGFDVLSLDTVVHTIYKLKQFIKQTVNYFPSIIINEQIDKKALIEKLKNPAFKKDFQNFLYPKLKDYVNNYLNKNYYKNVVVEVPLLFESNMDSLFSYNIGIISENQENLIKQRDVDYKEKLELNKNILFYKNQHKLDWIIENNGSLDELKNKVKDLISKLHL